VKLENWLLAGDCRSKFANGRIDASSRYESLSMSEGSTPLIDCGGFSHCPQDSPHEHVWKRPTRKIDAGYLAGTSDANNI